MKLNGGVDVKWFWRDECDNWTCQVMMDMGNIQNGDPEEYEQALLFTRLYCLASSWGMRRVWSRFQQHCIYPFCCAQCFQLHIPSQEDSQYWDPIPGPKPDYTPPKPEPKLGMVCGIMPLIHTHSSISAITCAYPCPHHGACTLLKHHQVLLPLSLSLPRHLKSAIGQRRFLSMTMPIRGYTHRHTT